MPQPVPTRGGRAPAHAHPAAAVRQTIRLAKSALPLVQLEVAVSLGRPVPMVSLGCTVGLRLARAAAQLYSWHRYQYMYYE